LPASLPNIPAAGEDGVRGAQSPAMSNRMPTLFALANAMMIRGQALLRRWFARVGSKETRLIFPKASISARRIVLIFWRANARAA